MSDPAFLNSGTGYCGPKLFPQAASSQHPFLAKPLL
jgi:hypothetical protein